MNVIEELKRNFMTTFTIDTDNNITAFASPISKSVANAEAFSNPEELTALTATWPGARLVEIWNSLPGVEPARRFTSRQIAVTRIWKAIQNLKPTAQKRAGRAKNKSSGRENSKTSLVIALLQQPEGATLQAIVKATGWQTHSVRGFVSGQLKKKLGLKVRSSQRDGERVYSIKH